MKGRESGPLEFVRSESLCCCSWHWGLVMRRVTIDSTPASS
jgi:hypothetical protein